MSTDGGWTCCRLLFLPPHECRHYARVGFAADGSRCGDCRGARLRNGVPAKHAIARCPPARLRYRSCGLVLPLFGIRRLLQVMRGSEVLAFVIAATARNPRGYALAAWPKYKMIEQKGFLRACTVLSNFRLYRPQLVTQHPISAHGLATQHPICAGTVRARLYNFEPTTTCCFTCRHAPQMPETVLPVLSTVSFCRSDPPPPQKLLSVPASVVHVVRLGQPACSALARRSRRCSRLCSLPNATGRITDAQCACTNDRPRR